MLRVVSMFLVIVGFLGFGAGIDGIRSSVPGAYMMTNITFIAAAILIGVGLLVWVLTDIRDTLNKPQVGSP